VTVTDGLALLVTIGRTERTGRARAGQSPFAFRRFRVVSLKTLGIFRQVVIRRYFGGRINGSRSPAGSSGSRLMTQLVKAVRRKAATTFFTEALADVLVQTVSRVCEFLLVIVSKTLDNGPVLRLEFYQFVSQASLLRPHLRTKDCQM
jgi:hypothetical protein